MGRRSWWAAIGILALCACERSGASAPPPVGTPRDARETPTIDATPIDATGTTTSPVPSGVPAAADADYFPADLDLSPISRSFLSRYLRTLREPPLAAVTPPGGESVRLLEIREFALSTPHFIRVTRSGDRAELVAGTMKFDAVSPDGRIVEYRRRPLSGDEWREVAAALALATFDPECDLSVRDGPTHHAEHLAAGRHRVDCGSGGAELDEVLRRLAGPGLREPLPPELMPKLPPLDAGTAAP